MSNPIRDIQYAAKHAADAYEEMNVAKSAMQGAVERFERATVAWLESSKSLTEKIDGGLFEAGVTA